MAWNEPGGNSGGKRNNPWGSGNKPEQGPPDLDEVLRNLQRRLAGLFGGGGGGNRTVGAGGPGRGFGIGTIALVLAAIWLFSGLYTVDAAERGIILRFGKHVATTEPGLRWHLPWPIETKQIVNIQSIESFSEQTRMLTADENMVDINLEVQFRRANPLDYAFNVTRPEDTLKEVSESAIREIIGRSKLDSVLESGRQEIVARTKDLIQRTLEAYKVGLEVTAVNLQDVKVPNEVAPAQQDAIKAREDRDRLSLAAQAYSNDLIPRARGAAVRQVQEAQAYRARKIANAEGEANRFLALLDEYEQAPGVTRERLYLETIERVLASSKKVVLDTQNGSGNLIYLPIDKLLEQSRRVPRVATSEPSMTVESADHPDSTTVTGDRRTRGTR
ncbi:FtsH protease activity modulator HflK [Steroidobacter sp. S1-65]|uniref:Protein HflK n=1 Tax=Steroidobacter gossypii TaxID=2805490 RepID=A0ABS1X6B5_9GAMM|nr:FtsH protease activity modulator HflK [Steroidobacter gossypii]MBM0108763.1 FtsH protease activity modulator HflK [Steroidobacter gossypii]